MTSEKIGRLWIAAHAQLSDESPEEYFARILIGRTRIAVLEEAAKECEKAYSYDPEALVIADKIRALKEN